MANAHAQRLLGKSAAKDLIRPVTDRAASPAFLAGRKSCRKTSFALRWLGDRRLHNSEVQKEEGAGQSIFLYANQPGVVNGYRFYAQFTSFIDFLAALAALDSKVYRLMVPCLAEGATPEAECATLDLPENVIELSWYGRGNHVKAAWSSFINALRARRLIQEAAQSGADMIVGGPGPNSFLFWLSLITPRKVRFAFFIRGNTVETLRNMYRGRLLYYPFVWTVKLFRWRLCRLLQEGRATVFTFGDQLRQYYANYRKAGVFTISPLIFESYLRKEARQPISDAGPLRVLYVGRLSQEKNIMALLEACRRAREHGRPFRLTIVGVGPLETEIASFIREFGLTDWIHLVGYVRNGIKLIEHYDRHDVLCLPSFTEGMPGVVAEACARGMPVIATRVGALPGFFPEAIRFLDGFGAESIEEALAWGDANREELSLYGQKGFAKIDRFLISQNAKTVDQIIRERSSCTPLAI